jgi:hypothetical protein
MFCMKPTQRPAIPSKGVSGTWEMSGTWEICINSKLSYIPLPVSPPLGTAVQLVSSIKAGVMIRFIKNSSNDCLGIDPDSDFIRHLCKGGTNWPWMQEGWDNIPVTKACKGSSIAALSFSNRETPSRHVFYQDPMLHVRDHYMDPNKEHDGWNLGERIIVLSLSMDEGSLHWRFPGLWHTTAWNAHNG